MEKLKRNKLVAATLICGFIPLTSLLLSVFQIRMDDGIRLLLSGLNFVSALTGLILAGIGSRNARTRTPALTVAALLCGSELVLMIGFLLLAWMLPFLS
jgi:hypothetical protein